MKSRYKSRYSSSHQFATSSWTKRFFRLGKPDDNCTADRDYVLLLENKQLGAKRFKFDDKRGDHEHFMKKLREEYPLLASQNGAIMLRTSNSGGSHHRPLQKLLPGREGYTIGHVKNIINSSRVYITHMQSSLQETPQNETRTNSSQAVCSICKSHVNLNIFMNHLDRCSAKMLEEDENERAMGDICNSTENHCNDKVSSLLEMFPHIDKERIEDMVKRNTSI